MTAARKWAIAGTAVLGSIVAVPLAVLSVGVGHSSGLLWVSGALLPYAALLVKAAGPESDSAALFVIVFLIAPIGQACAYSYFLVVGPRRRRLVVLAVHAAAAALFFAL